ncbi:MAG TPA: hypothetical protein VLA88_06585 [Candidatus Saccharimonadales bacterium]|nr:hypothetical protein [Candidatus Saccharimonadales bacterium]
MQPSTHEPDQQSQRFYHAQTPADFPDTQLGETGAPVQDFDEHEQVTWEASEYIHRAKDAKWGIVFGLVVLAFLTVAVWVHEWLFAVLIVVMGATMGYFAFRPPQTKHYTLTHHSIKVDDKVYMLSDYRAFGVLAEEAFYSAILVPTARFKPALTMYFAEDDAEKIIDILSTHLLVEDIKPDPIDIIMRRLHF